jgi:hypothetical protein
VLQGGFAAFYSIIAVELDKMVQKTFGIYTTTDITADDEQLYIELGQRHVALWTAADTTETISAFELFEYDLSPLESLGETLRQVKLYSRLLEARYSSTKVIWENQECLLVPDSFHDKEIAPNYLDLMFGNSVNTLVQEQQRPTTRMTVVFRIPRNWKDAAQQYFPGAVYEHKYLNLYERFSNDSKGIYTLFYRNHFIMALVKEFKVQLLQTFDYQTPEDALYHILNTCNQYKMDYDTTPVHVEGLIDLNSPMYEELKKYLRDVSISIPGEKWQTGGDFRQHPSHYFLPFFKMMA